MKLSEVASQLNSDSEVVLPSLLFLTDELRITDPLSIAKCLPKGSGIVLRDYENSDRLTIAKKLAEISYDRDLTLLIGDDIEIAQLIRADGVHFREKNIPTTNLKEINEDFIFTVAAHSLESLHKAGRVGASAALLSPVFSTKSHPDQKPLGVRNFRNLVSKSPLPIYALGGINNNNAHELLSSKAIGLAAIDGIAEEYYPLTDI